MIYKVNINKETGLGKAENPYPKLMERPEFNDERVSNIDWVRFDNLNSPLPVYDQNNNQVKEGEFECEKVWQVNIPGYEEYRDLKPGETVEVMKSLNRSTRQIYRVVKQEEEGTVEQAAHKYACDYVYPIKGLSYDIQSSQQNRGMVELLKETFIAGSSFQKSKTIDEVVVVVDQWIKKHDCWQSKFRDLIEQINNLR